MLQTKRFVAALVLVGALMLAFGTNGALAGPNVDACVAPADDASVCTSAESVVIDETAGSSGSVSFTANQRKTPRVSEEGRRSWAVTGNDHLHHLANDGLLGN